MLGWITDREARALGMTHRCRLYGLLPGYAGDVDSEGLTILFKHVLIDWIEPLFTQLYMLACQVSGNEPMFGIQLRGRI